MQPLDTVATGLPPLSAAEFERFSRLARQACGLELRSGKQTLVEVRLAKHVRRGGFRSFEEYYRHVVGDRSGSALDELIDSLTTNFTSFFREPAHFEFLRHTALPALAARREAKIWSCACATGEEPWSIAMTVLEQGRPSGRPRVRILASDISRRALAIARAGVYPLEKCQDLPAELLRSYFQRGTGASHGCCRVRPELREMLEFKRLNLLSPAPDGRCFAIIFLRNVMIYFDRETQQRVLDNILSCLEPGGWLLLGHAESLTGLRHDCQYIQPATYRKPMRSRLVSAGA